MSKQTETFASFPPAVPAFWNYDGASFTSAVDNYNAWLNDAAKMQEESLRFLKARMSADMQAATEFAACKTPAEVIDLQVKYGGKAVSAFVEEGKKMFELCTHRSVAELRK